MHEWLIANNNGTHLEYMGKVLMCLQDAEVDCLKWEIKQQEDDIQQLLLEKVFPLSFCVWQVK